MNTLPEQSAVKRLDKTFKHSNSETGFNHLPCKVQMEETFVLFLRLTYDRLVFITSQVYITGF